MSGKLKRTTYRLDLLRAELEGPKHGLTDPKSQSIHFTVLWLWAASARTGHFESDFRTFKTICTNFEVVAAAGAEVQGVPPTDAAPNVPHSPSLQTTDTPTTPEPGSSS
jgi:hypothetical protein